MTKLGIQTVINFKVSQASARRAKSNTVLRKIIKNLALRQSGGNMSVQQGLCNYLWNGTSV